MLSHLLRAGFLLALASPALATPADDCRNRDLEDAQRLPLCTAAIDAADDPRDRADLLLWRGAIQDRLGARDAALIDLAEAQALAPGWADPLVERAYLHHGAGDGAAALADLARAREVEPDSAYALLESMNIMADLGDPQGCLALAGDAFRVAAEDPYAYAYRGRCVHDSGRPEEAMADYQQAIDMGLEEAFVHSNLAGALLDLGRPGEAVPPARHAHELDPTDGFALRNYALALFDSGDVEGGLAAFHAGKAALTFHPDVAPNDIAWRLYELDRPGDGLPIIEEWLSAAGPFTADHANALDTYAHLLAAAGRPGEATKTFLKVTELDAPARAEGYAQRLDGLGFGGLPLGEALAACAATGAACRLSD